MTIPKKALDGETNYLFQLIQKKDGAKSKAFICTPKKLLMTFADHDVPEDEQYINLIADIDSIQEGDLSEAQTVDLVMTVPLFSVQAFRQLFTMIEDANNGS